MPQDSLYLEAESGIIEAPMQVFDDPDASGGQFVMVQAGNESTGSPPASGKISLEVNLSAGTYKIWARVITPSETEDSFWVQVDDGAAYRWNGIGDFSNWTWAAVHDSDDNGRQVEWTLGEGIHTINIYYREEGAKIDEIYVSRFGDTPTKGNVIVTRKIHVSQELGDDGNDGAEGSPVRTLFRAYQLAHASKEEVTNYEILLRGGETYDDFQPIYGLDEAQGPLYFGFVWDINRPLKFSTYGPAEKAHLLGSKHRYEGGPTLGLLVIDPSEQDVLIENLFFEMWQEGALMVFETEDVHIRNIKINKIGTYYFPGEQTSPGSSSFPYTAGVVYPKNSTRILMEDIEMTNCHNLFDQVTALHGFYGTRLSESEIRNCYLRNVSGSPFKFRRSAANNVYIQGNEAYYTGHTEFQESWEQPGFLRYSGDPGGDCPFALVFENNIFHYPFCWSEYGEDCDNAEAILCSVSNTNSCGEDACIDPEKVQWIDNDIIYAWVPGQETDPPSVPFGIVGSSDSESTVTIQWFDTNINEEAFVVELKTPEGFVEVARLGPNASQFTQSSLAPLTAYEYRVYVENGLGRSDFSDTVSVTTKAPNRAPVAVIDAPTFEGIAPIVINFNARESYDPDGDNMIYAWLVDDVFRSNRDTLSYTFEAEGIYEISLILEDGRLSSDTTVLVTISDPLNTKEEASLPFVYPNPSTGAFSFAYVEQVATVEIYDLSGARIATFGQQDLAEPHVLPTGIYTVVIISANDSLTTTKLIVR